MVGNPFTVYSTVNGISLVVASILAMVSTSLLSFKAVANLDQIGASRLQNPHQGAYNSTRTSFDLSNTKSSKDFPTITLTSSSYSFSGTTSDFKCGFNLPLANSSTNLAT
eukprot:NODE_21_length_42443_cov_0.822808.p36 type:complete len:110 gc:universal NODE_21_length_42443_cov_0.822808:39316-39645(+)